MPLAPSLTEMLFFVVPDSNIIAVTPNCNFPPNQVAQKTRVEVYPVDIEKITALKPDIIFTEEGMISPDQTNQLEQLGYPVFIFRYRTCGEIVAALDSLWNWLPRRPESRAKIDSLHAELNFLEEKRRGQTGADVPKVLAITYHDPIFAFGYDTWMTDKIRLAGGKNVLQKELDKPYPVLSRESVLQMNPDYLFGGSFERMDSTFFRLYPELRNTTAWKRKRIFSLNDDLASRPSPRFLEGIVEIQIYLQK